MVLTLKVVKYSRILLILVKKHTKQANFSLTLQSITEKNEFFLSL